MSTLSEDTGWLLGGKREVIKTPSLPGRVLTQGEGVWCEHCDVIVFFKSQKLIPSTTSQSSLEEPEVKTGEKEKGIILEERRKRGERPSVLLSTTTVSPK